MRCGLLLMFFPSGQEELFDLFFAVWFSEKGVFAAQIGAAFKRFGFVYGASAGVVEEDAFALFLDIVGGGDGTGWRDEAFTFTFGGSEGEDGILIGEGDPDQVILQEFLFIKAQESGEFSEIFRNQSSGVVTACADAFRAMTTFHERTF